MQNAPEDFDVIAYAGAVSRIGYEKLCETLKAKTCSRVLLVLATLGGDPHAGFRIARALQHHYDHFDMLVPRVCKSAGTLIAIGAERLFLDDMSELGPLDVQVKKGDELQADTSGLEFLGALHNLQSQSLETFRAYLMRLANDGLSTRIASDIAANLTAGLFQPIAGQIDPIRLAETQRATEIAHQYGQRLNERFSNAKPGAVNNLIFAYPSHSFVIDRKEARKMFERVSKPDATIANYSQALGDVLAANLTSVSPVVFQFQHPSANQPL